MQMLPDRDERVLEFVEEFKAVRASVLQELFYPSYRIAARRLATLSKLGCLKRERIPGRNEYYYYTTKPKNIKHALIVADTYAYLHRTTTLHDYIIEPTFDDVRPDIFVAYEKDGANEIAFVEVELSNKGFDIAKYEHLYASGAWKKHFPKYPKILAITNKRVPQTALEVEVIPIANLY